MIFFIVIPVVFLFGQLLIIHFEHNPTSARVKIELPMNDKLQHDFIVAGVRNLERLPDVGLR